MSIWKGRMSLAVPPAVLMMTSVVGGGADHRSDRNAACTSVVKSCGSCQAAKWLPLATSLK
jgi:hypothetical protein